MSMSEPPTTRQFHNVPHHILTGANGFLRFALCRPETESSPSTRNKSPIDADGGSASGVAK